MTRTVVVSGKTYSACLDPHATGVPKELDLPEPSIKRQGFGFQHTYFDLTEYQRFEMLHHLWTVGTGFEMGPDADTRAEARAILKDWEKNR
jgi:hypothetical protein